MANYAVILTGGKQYRVSVGQQVTVEKLEANRGDEVSFDQVLLVARDGQVAVGAPTVAGARVVGQVVEQTRDNKVIVHNYRRRKNSRKTIGHRQPITRVRIASIEA
ncbi:MAG: 50S ribosomal protein L21 [Deltaproteobacteria bacterium]|nr:50S ribosomal protein L21 [Deltaproteobacteria bacterium]